MPTDTSPSVSQTQPDTPRESPSLLIELKPEWCPGLMKATSLPQPSTWPVLSVFSILGFFFSPWSTVLHEVRARMSQPLAGTLLGSRKPFHRRMGPPGSQCRDVEPMTTVLTAGSTKQSTPHYCRVTHCGLKKMQAERCWHCERNRARMQHSGTQQHINQKPCAVSELLFREFFDEIGSCKYMMVLKRIRRVCP